MRRVEDVGARRSGRVRHHIGRKDAQRAPYHADRAVGMVTATTSVHLVQAPGVATEEFWVWSAARE